MSRKTFSVRNQMRFMQSLLKAFHYFLYLQLIYVIKDSLHPFPSALGWTITIFSIIYFIITHYTDFKSRKIHSEPIPDLKFEEECQISSFNIAEEH